MSYSRTSLEPYSSLNSALIAPYPSLDRALIGRVSQAYLADRHMFMLCCFFPLTLMLVALVVEEERFDGDLTAIRADMRGLSL